MRYFIEKRPIVLWPNVTGGLPGLSRWRIDGGSLMKVEAEVKVESKIQALFFLSLDLSLSLPLAGGLFQHSAELLLLIGFKERMLYTTKITFGGIGVRSERQYHGHVTTQSNLRQ